MRAKEASGVGGPQELIYSTAGFNHLLVTIHSQYQTGDFMEFR